MERLVFGLEFQNGAGEEVEKLYIMNDKEAFYIEEVRVVSHFRPDKFDLGISGSEIGEVHVTVDVKKAPFAKYLFANDNLTAI